MAVREEKTAHYHAYHGDCIAAFPLIPDNSIGLTVTSPPFSNLYQYNASEADIGNCTSEEQFFAHYTYVTQELLRVTMPGRLAAIHVTDIPAMQVRDGWIGLKNFSGHMADHMVAHGWIYHGRYVLDRNPQSQAIRIRAKGLAFQQLHKDASWMRGALPDNILLFRKPGENVTPIIPDIDNETWIEWAHPVWYSNARDKHRGIRETYTLNVAEARESDDDRHICPFALDLVERCVRLWSNKDDHVFDPNAGIFSTGFIALQNGRFPVCIELKESYFETGLKNLHRALTMQHQGSLF